MKTIATVLAVGTGLFAFAPPAFADGLSHDTRVGTRFTPSFAANRAGITADLWPTRDNFSTSFGAELHLRAAPKLFLDLRYQGAFAHVGDAADAGDYLGFGNPIVGVHFADTPTHGFSYFIGGSIAAPLLQDPSTQVKNAAFYGERNRGYYDADRFVLGHTAVRGSLGMEVQSLLPFILRGEVNPVVYIPTSDKYAAFPETRAGLPSGKAGDTAVTIEHALELELRADVGFGAGVRLQGVFMPTQNDMFQSVAEPFLQVVPKREGLYARVGVPVAIDPDLGLGLTGNNKLAGIRVNIGGQW